jgi:hypothetical protein
MLVKGENFDACIISALHIAAPKGLKYEVNAKFGSVVN